MNHDRFDDLSRALATTTSRRQFLKTLAGGAAGGLLALLGVREATADDLCKPNGKKCRKNAQCCSGSCVNGTCAPQQSGHPFTCICQDGTPLATCNPATCDFDGLDAVCGSLCVNHGGFSSAACNSATCTSGSQVAALIDAQGNIVSKGAAGAPAVLVRTNR